MKISLAKISDLQFINSITKRCAADMISRGIYQWNENYPSRNILKKDIELKQLWKLTSNEVILGLVVLTEIEDEVYKKISWLTKNYRNIYVHRLAVDPENQGKGYARKLMDFAEEYAVVNNYSSIRLDTFSQNKRNQRFYEKRNYSKLDEIFLPDQSNFPFFCYEKVLNV